MNRYYFNKVWMQYGYMAMSLGLQMMLYFQMKNRELNFIRQIAENPEMDHSQFPFGTIHQFDMFYFILWIFDLLIVVQFISLNYHKQYWKKVSKEFYKLGYFYDDFKMKHIPFSEEPLLYT